MSYLNNYDEIIDWLGGFLNDTGLEFTSTEDGMIYIETILTTVTVCLWQPGEESYVCGCFKLPVNAWRITIQSASIKRQDMARPGGGKAYLVSDPNWVPFLKELIECTP